MTTEAECPDCSDNYEQGIKRGVTAERKRVETIINARHKRHFGAGGVDHDLDVRELRAIFGEIFDEAQTPQQMADAVRSDV